MRFTGDSQISPPAAPITNPHSEQWRCRHYLLSYHTIVWFYCLHEGIYHDPLHCNYCTVQALGICSTVHQKPFDSGFTCRVMICMHLSLNIAWLGPKSTLSLVITACREDHSSIISFPFGDIRGNCSSFTQLPATSSASTDTGLNRWVGARFSQLRARLKQDMHWPYICTCNITDARQIRLFLWFACFFTWLQSRLHQHG